MSRVLVLLSAVLIVACNSPTTVVPTPLATPSPTPTMTPASTAASPAGSATATSGSLTVRVTKADDGATKTLRPGDTLVVELAEAAGYRWEYETAPDARVLKEAGVRTYLAAGTGETRISLVQLRTSATGEGDRFSLTVVVT